MNKFEVGELAKLANGQIVQVTKLNGTWYLNYRVRETGKTVEDVIFLVLFKLTPLEALAMVAAE